MKKRIISVFLIFFFSSNLFAPEEAERFYEDSVTEEETNQFEELKDYQDQLENAKEQEAKEKLEQEIKKQIREEYDQKLKTIKDAHKDDSEYDYEKDKEYQKIEAKQRSLEYTPTEKFIDKELNEIIKNLTKKIKKAPAQDYADDTIMNLPYEKGKTTLDKIINKIKKLFNIDSKSQALKSIQNFNNAYNDLIKFEEGPKKNKNREEERILQEKLTAAYIERDKQVQNYIDTIKEESPNLYKQVQKIIKSARKAEKISAAIKDVLTGTSLFGSLSQGQINEITKVQLMVVKQLDPTLNTILEHIIDQKEIDQKDIEMLKKEGENQENTIKKAIEKIKNSIANDLNKQITISESKSSSIKNIFDKLGIDINPLYTTQKVSDLASKVASIGEKLKDNHKIQNLDEEQIATLFNELEKITFTLPEEELLKNEKISKAEKENLDFIKNQKEFFVDFIQIPAKLAEKINLEYNDLAVSEPNIKKKTLIDAILKDIYDQYNKYNPDGKKWKKALFEAVQLSYVSNLETAPIEVEKAKEEKETTSKDKDKTKKGKIRKGIERFKKGIKKEVNEIKQEIKEEGKAWKAETLLGNLATSKNYSEFINRLEQRIDRLEQRVGIPKQINAL